MPQAYASGSSVSIGRSKEQIESELRRMGASRRAFFDDDEHGRAVVVFEMADVRYRVMLPLANPKGDRFWRTPARGYLRTKEQALAAWEQEVRERWRALAEYVKSLRIAQEAGIIQVREALLAHVVLPDGQTVGEYVLSQLPEALSAGRMPPLLPGVSEPLPSPRLLKGE